MVILVKWRRRRRGPHRKESGKISGSLSLDRRMRSSNSKNGLSIAYNFELSKSEVVTVSLIELTRSDRLNAAITLSSSSGDGALSARDPPYSITIGKSGQQSKVFKTGVPGIQNS